MYDAVFQSIKNTPNVGDLICSPYSYFDFGQQRHDDFGETIPATKRAILGGGQAFGKCADAVIYHSEAAQHKVIWGIGLSPKAASGIQFDIVKANCSLFSTRNTGFDNLDFVPCVSAMNAAFDAPADPQHDVVVFSHATKSDGLQVPDNIPHISNHGGTAERAIAHIASGETVVTNSYHGTYWALLLRRKVLCLPFKDKFNHFPQTPAMSSIEDWQKDLGKAYRPDDTLEEARVLNQQFFEKVMNLG